MPETFEQSYFHELGTSPETPQKPPSFSEKGGFAIVLSPSLASIHSQIPVLFSSVLKSTLFTPNSSPQSSLSIPDLFSPSEIRTFRCYEGTAHKLRPSPFGTHFRSLEFFILLSKPNSILKLQLVSYSLWKLGQK
jgi:hypothetical protein